MIRNVYTKKIINYVDENFSLSIIATGIFLSFGMQFKANAEDDVYFDPQLMEVDVSGQSEVDLSIFNQKNSLPPGVYRTHINVNGKELFEKDITFRLMSNKKTEAVITPDFLRELGVNMEKFPELEVLSPDATIQNLEKYIPSASFSLNVSRMILSVSLPQASLYQKSYDYIDPKFWNDGLPVIFSNYTYSGSNSTSDISSESNQTSHYLNLQNGMNVGPWRLRNYTTFNDYDGEGGWDSIYTYVERDVKFLKSQLTLGQSFTSGDIFDSVQFNGIQLASDDNMLPNSQRGFAPVIHGIANSNAEITIRQNGYIIYQSTVSPGAFEINDLNATSSSGDLEVTIKESNGAERRFIQPFSAVPIMQRPGRVKYNLVGGEYRSSNNDDKTPYFIEGTAIYGVNNELTVYGGGQFAENYNAGDIGVGYSLGELGSISFDGIYAESQLRDNTQSTGQSYRLQYSKNIDLTNTSIMIAGYRYSTSGYHTFSEVNEVGTDELDSIKYNKRSQYQLNINQSLLENVTFYLSMYQQNFWNTGDKEKTISAGMSASYNDISYSFTYSDTKQADDSNRQISLGISIPLSKWLPHTWASYNATQDNDGNIRQQVGLSGTALDDNRLSYSLQQSYTAAHDGGDTYQSSTIGATYKSSYADLNAGYSYSDHDKKINYGLSGAVVVHQHGISLSQPLGDSFALIDSNGVSGVHFKNQPGIQTDMFGYAVVPYLMTYKENKIVLDTTALPDGVDADNTTQTLIPNKGAMVLAHFDARKGYRVLLTLHKQGGGVVPFGAIVTLEGQNNKQTIVDEGGTVYLTGINDQSILNAKWGNEASQQCKAKFGVPDISSDAQGIISLSTECL